MLISNYAGLSAITDYGRIVDAEIVFESIRVQKHNRLRWSSRILSLKMAIEKMRSDAETEAAVPTGQRLLRKARTTFKILSKKFGGGDLRGERLVHFQG